MHAGGTTGGIIMTSSAPPGSGQDDATSIAGRKTGQHVSGAAEPGTFVTDDPPTADTPAHGSTNAGINKLGANRPDPDDDDATGEQDA
jgi:hypothetical protein